MSFRRSGINTLAYTGVEPATPPNIIIDLKSPTQFDTNYNIGDIWLVGQLNGNGVFQIVIEIWILTILDNLATWTQVYPISSTGAGVFPANIGTAIVAGGILNVHGASHITTSGVGNTVSIDLSGAIADSFVTDAGTAIAVSGDLNVLGTSVLQTIGAGNNLFLTFTTNFNGQLIIGGGASPAWANLTSTGGTITITNGPNSINLEAGGGATANTYQADSGSAHPSLLGVIDYLGGTNINTSGAGQTITVNLNNNVHLAGSLHTGTTLTAGTGLTVNAGGIDSTGTTRLRDLTAGVMQTDNAGVVSSSNGTNGQLLIGATGSAPAWNVITSTDGSITIANSANHIGLKTTSGGGIGSGPAFLAFTSGTSAGGTLGTTAGILTILYDQGGNFYPGDGVSIPASFTAPTTGIYYLDFYGVFQSTSGNTTQGRCSILTPNRNYIRQRFLTTLNGYITVGLSVCADLTAGDKVTYQVFAANRLLGYSFFSNEIRTRVSGYRIA